VADQAMIFRIWDGTVWFCRSDGTPVYELGPSDKVLAAMRQLLGPGNVGETVSFEQRREGTELSFAHTSRTDQQPHPSGSIKINRDGERHELTIAGKIYTATGSREIIILDLSENGCRFRERTGHLAPGTGLTIKVGSIGPLPAVIRWTRRNEVGASFDNPIHPTVLVHIRQQFRSR